VAVIAVLIGIFISGAIDSWVPFAISVVVFAILQWFENKWLHDHIHTVAEGWEDDHGDKTIE